MTSEQDNKKADNHNLMNAKAGHSCYPRQLQNMPFMSNGLTMALECKYSWPENTEDDALAAFLCWAPP